MAREERNGGGMYFLLDSNNQTVARGMLRGPEEDMALQIKVLDDKISDVMRHEQIRLVSLKGNTPAMVTKVTRCHNGKALHRQAQEPAGPHPVPELHLPPGQCLAGQKEYPGQRHQLRRRGVLLRGGAPRP